MKQATENLPRRRFLQTAALGAAAALPAIPALAAEVDAELLSLCRQIDDLAVQEREAGEAWQSAFDATKIEARRRTAGRALSTDEIGNVYEAVSRELGEDELGLAHDAVWKQIDILYKRAALITPQTLAGLAALARATAHAGSFYLWDEPISELDWDGQRLEA